MQAIIIEEARPWLQNEDTSIIDGVSSQASKTGEAKGKREEVMRLKKPSFVLVGFPMEFTMTLI